MFILPMTFRFGWFTLRNLVQKATTWNQRSSVFHHRAFTAHNILNFIGTVCSISSKLLHSVISLAHTLIQDSNLQRFGVVQFKENCTHTRFATDLFDCDMLRCVLIFHGFVRSDGFLSICVGYNLMKCLSLFHCSAVLEIFLRQYLPQSLLKWREPYLVPSKNLPTEVCLLFCKN